MIMAFSFSTSLSFPSKCFWYLVWKDKHGLCLVSRKKDEIVQWRTNSVSQPLRGPFFFSFLAHHGNSRSTFVNVKRIYEANWGIETMNEKRFQCKKLTKTEGVLLNNQKAHSVSVTEKNQDPPPQKHIICPSGSFMRFPPKFLSQWRPFPCSSPHWSHT